MRRVSGRRHLLLAIALVAWWLPFGWAWGQTAVDEQVREIASVLRCPVCQNLSVADSPSEMAQQMRAVIRERLSAGQSRAEIEAYFVAKYGQWVLLSPRRSGFNLVLWIGPFVAVVVGLLAAARLARRWARRRGAGAAQAVDPAVLERVRTEAADERMGDPGSASPLERDRARLYEALRELAFDYRAGKLSAEDYEAMRAEYEARAAAVLLDLDAAVQRTGTGRARARADKPASRAPAPGTASPRRRTLRNALAAAFLVVFGVTVGVFLTQSLRPRASSMDSMTGDFLTGTGPGGVSPTLSFSSNTIERNLSEGRAAVDRGDFRMAIDHFKAVLETDRNNPIALSYLGIVLSRGGHADAAIEMVERAIRAAPDHPLALWANGLVLYEMKRDYAGAVRTLETLLQRPLAPDDADAVARLLADARQKLASAAGSTEKASPSMPAVGVSRRITGTVLLAEGVGRHVPADGTLFVIARQGAGPPLAVKRIIAPKFPVTFTLGPEDVMMKGPEFAGTVTLIARLKRDGRAGAADRGDLEGAAAGPIAVGTTNARITLDIVR